MSKINRREFIFQTAVCTGGLSLGLHSCVNDYFFKEGEFMDLPLYTTSFFPLFFSALGQKMPDHIDRRMREYILREQQIGY